MANYDFKPFENKIAASKEWLVKEYRGLRSGRATPVILDSVMVSAYGSVVALKSTATVGIEDARTLRVQPFDPSLVKDIEHGITTANLGVGTVSDGVLIRVTFPELTAERREQFVKLAKGKLEDARTTVRIARDETWKDIQEKERTKVLTEDDKFRLKDELQKKTDAANEELKKSFERKEEEMKA